MFVSLVDSLRSLREKSVFRFLPLKYLLSAISAGKINSHALLDLCYEEDSSAEVDMNFVMNHRGEYIEIQGTGEGGVFSAGALSELLVLGGKGTQEVIEKQKEALSLDESELSFS